MSLKENGFQVLAHHLEDPKCDGATLWLALKNGCDNFIVFGALTFP
jgi:hypothetical protein